MAAVLFGSISSLADTSELQRDAFNTAFSEAGLDWNWDRASYVRMLQDSGGRDRIASYAKKRGEQVDADTLHRRKSEIFRQALSDGQASPRPGVVETIAAAKQRGVQVGLVTTTSPDNVSALLGALHEQIDADDFAVVTDTTSVDAVKPDPAVYVYAVRELGEQVGECVAIEDNIGGVQSAVAAGLSCIAFPNANTQDHDFTPADVRVSALDPDDVLARAVQS